MRRVACLLSLVVLVPVVASAVPVRWTYEEGGNGHWYEYVNGLSSWDAANVAAAAMAHDGHIGYLATITRAEEDQWVRRTFAIEQHIWLGGHGPSTQPWMWVTGEPWDYTNWEAGEMGSWFSGLCMTADGWSAHNHVIIEHPYLVEYPSADLFMEGSLRLADIPNDQGGSLSLTWLRSSLDASALPESITTYHAQRFQNGSWETLTSVAAAYADTYRVTVPTPDVFTIGAPEPFSTYRVVASSSDPTKFYLSAVDSAYSIDNIVPPKPIVTMHEGAGFRVLVCDDPAIPDLGQVCVYRGAWTGFVPAEPSACSGDLLFLEAQLNNFYYRVQFRDIHGNASEFSDEVGSQPASGVDDALPTRMALSQNVPNPFNPSTVIQFSLPKTATVSLRIHDVSGKLVRNLIDGQIIDAGQRETLWNGQDDAGRQVPAGVYFYRLNAGNFVDVKRMALVK